MNASSVSEFELFSKLNTRQIKCLLSVLGQSVMNGKQFVERAYREQASNFLETVQFLKAVNWIEELGEEFSLCDAGTAAHSKLNDDAEIRKLLGKALIGEENPYRDTFVSFILRFRPIGSELIYRPSISERLYQSSLRNFLIDIGAVAHRASDDSYIVDDDASDLYICAMNLRRTGSKEAFQSRVARQEALGIAGEEAILSFEKSRVGAQLAHNVEHVSAKMPFACYDIKSVTLENGKLAPRYIEVKSVSAENYQFYWTRSEVQVAQLLRMKYYLYLVPVAVAGGFNIEKMLMLNDPYANVYQNGEHWQTEENVIVCRRRN